MPQQDKDNNRENKKDETAKLGMNIIRMGRGRN